VYVRAKGAFYMTSKAKSTSKKNTTVSLNGLLDYDEGTITEQLKDADLVYRFDEILRQFDGKEVSIMIKESTELESV
jgi:hypothetical protein